MIVDCASYCDGHRDGGLLTISEAAAQAHTAAMDGENRFVWAGLHEPTDEEFHEAVAAFGLDALAVRDAAREHQRPKLQVFSDDDPSHPTTVLLVLKPAWYVDSVEIVELGQLALFVTDHAVLSVRHGDSGPLTDARARLEHDPNRLVHGPTAVLATILQHVVDEYVRVIIDLEKDIDEIEGRVFDGARADHGERIFNLKREVLDFRRAVEPLERPLRELARGEVPVMDESATRLFVDQLDDCTRVSEHLHNLDALLDSALSANVASVGMRQNEDMRKISAGAALITVPTLIAGIYGMNFDDMPELHWSTGYPMAIGMMVGAVALLYWQFKKREWL